MSVVAVWGAPGAGKTTLSINLAYALSKKNKTTLLVSPEDYGELSALLGVNVPIEKSLSTALNGKSSLKNIVVEVNPYFYILSASTSCDSFEVVSSDEQAKELLSMSRILFDDVIIDCPTPKNSSLSAWAMSEADKVLIVYGGRITHSVWATANYRVLNPLLPKTTYVINKTAPQFDYEALGNLLGCFGASEIPHIPNAIQLINEQTIFCGSMGKNGRRYTMAIYDLIARLIL